MSINEAHIIYKQNKILVLAELPGDTIYSRTFGEESYPLHLLEEQLRILREQGFVINHYHPCNRS